MFGFSLGALERDILPAFKRRERMKDQLWKVTDRKEFEVTGLPTTWNLLKRSAAPNISP